VAGRLFGDGLTDRLRSIHHALYALMRTLTLDGFHCPEPCTGPVIFATYSEHAPQQGEGLIGSAGDAICRTCKQAIMRVEGDAFES
jgi:hypothetical protein